MNNLDYPLPVLELVTALKQLPGIGTRGAERMALWMLQGHMGEAEAIARTIGQAAEHVTPCPVCGFFSTAGELCAACRDEERDSRLICVVEQATDVIPIERSSAYRGCTIAWAASSPRWTTWSRKTSISSPWWNASPGSRAVKSFWQRGPTWRGKPRPPTSTTCSKNWIARFPAPPRACPPAPGLSHADTLTLMKALEGRTAL